MKTLEVVYFIEGGVSLTAIFFTCVEYAISFKYSVDEIIFYADDMDDFKSIQSVLGSDIINESLIK